MRFLYTILFSLIVSSTVLAQVTVDNTVNGVDGVQDVLIGPGVTVSNITFNGNNSQIGSFTCTGVCRMGISNGLVMGSGNIDQVPGNSLGSSNAGPASGTSVTDADLVALTGLTIRDAAVLQFDFVPTGDTLQFKFVFGSEEYPEFVNSNVNDAFGFFLSGPGISGPYTNNAKNIALLPNGVTPVTIDNVNANSNSAYYVTNTTGPNTIECDAFTTILTAFSIVECGQTYHLKLAICDAGDALYDSFVFLEAGSFASNIVDLTFLQPEVAPGQNGIFEGCTEAGNISFTRPPGITGDLTYNLTFSGTATPGVDYSALPESIVFLDGVNSVLIPITAFDDSFSEGSESIIIQVESELECGSSFNDLILTIAEIAPLSVSIAPLVVPCNENAELMLNITGGFGSYEVNWGSYGLGNPLVINDPVNSQINYTVTDVCNVDPVSGTVDVSLQQYAPIQMTIGQDLVLDCNDIAEIPSSTIGGNGSYTFAWFVDDVQISTDEILTINDPTNSEVAVVATDGCGATGTDTLYITLPVTPIIIDLPTITPGTCNGTVEITAQISGGVGSYFYQWLIDGEVVGILSNLTTTSIQGQDIILVVTDECDNESQATTTIQIDPTPISVSLGNDLTITCLDAVTLDPTVSGGTGNYQYVWTIDGAVVSNSNTYVVNLDATEQITLAVNDECNASGQDVLIANVPAVPVVINMNATQDVVCLQNFVVAANSVTGGVGPLQYSWALNNSVYSQNPSFTYNTSTPVSFVLNVNDACGNIATDVIEIQLLPSQMSIETAANDDNICPDDQVILTATVSNAIGNVSYVWSTSSQASSIVVSPDITTTYVIGATDACGANLTDEVTINVLTQDGPLTVVEETEVCINITTSDLMSGGYLPYLVSFIDEENLNYSPQNGSFSSNAVGVYDFTVTDQCGFQQTGSVIVESCETIIPNVFSPNDDGKNEFFEIFGLEGFKNSTLTVWNRWGNKVYEISNYANNWDGDGTEDGVYFYVFNRSDGKDFEGSVHIIRK